jgi:hypothetical protein
MRRDGEALKPVTPVPGFNTRKLCKLCSRNCGSASCDVCHRPCAGMHESIRIAVDTASAHRHVCAVEPCGLRAYVRVGARNYCAEHGAILLGSERLDAEREALRVAV